MEPVQYIRIADVLLIGPALIYVSTKKEITKFDKYILITIGLGTIIYNAYHFIENYK